jgi:hypothetical protein
MNETEPSDNRFEPICRHQSIASANEGFFGVADTALLPRAISANSLPFDVDL